MGLYRMGPPDDLMLELSTEFSIANFVETGTYQGYTAVWASEHFRKVFTIELSNHFYRETYDKYKHLENIEFIFGDSRTKLKKIIGELKSPALFWLDAHWSGGETYGGDDQCPLIEEIKIIGNCRFDNFIFIDDARLFTSPPQQPHRPEQWSDIASIIKTIHADRSDKYIVIIEDVIIAVPAFAKTIVARYCQNTNAKLWEEYGRRHNKSNFRKGVELISNDLLSLMKTPVGKVYNFIGKRRRNNE